MTPQLQAWLALPAAFATGVGSALLPLVNAEAALVAAAVSLSAPTALGVCLALALGQSVGKATLFEAARRGTAHRAHTTRRPPRPWQQRLLVRMRGQARCDAVVLVSAVAGFPPLALTSVAAGALQGSIRHFFWCCLSGRAARFGGLLAATTWVR